MFELVLEHCDVIWWWENFNKLTIKKYAYVCLLHEKSNFKIIKIKMSYEHIWEGIHGVNNMVANALS
jgi:hypothetical protein